MPTTLVRRCSSLLSRSSGLVLHSLRQCATGTAVNAVRSRGHRPSWPQRGTWGQHGGDLVDLVGDLCGGRLGEAGADRGGDHLGRPSWHAGEHVAEELDAAALPAGPAMTAPMACLRPVWASETTSCTPGQAAGLQRAQERGPEGAVLAVTDVQAQQLPAAVGAHPGGDHHRPGDHPAIHAGLEVGRIHNRYGSRCGPASGTRTP